MKNKFVSAMALTLAMTLTACGGSTSGVQSDGSYALTVSGISGSLNYFPVYVADELGMLDEANIKLDEVLFTNGPVQMEALSSNSWDIGFTGVGGVLSGVLGYDAIILGATNTDDGTQYAFARNDSDIVQAGNGNNSISSTLYGDAESWRGSKILCNTGSVLHYLLVKTLGGFGLTQDDVQFIAMDVPTANSAFLAGEGDVVVLTGSAGTFPMLADTDNYTSVTSGKDAGTGVRCSIMANKNSYADEGTYEAMVAFIDVYFDALEWMAANPDEALTMMMNYSEASGNSMEADIAKAYLEADEYYTIEKACELNNTTAPNSSVSVMEQDIMNVLDFFIDCGSYTSEDAENFKNHVDTKLLNDVLAIR